MLATQTGFALIGIIWGLQSNTHVQSL